MSIVLSLSPLVIDTATYEWQPASPVLTHQARYATLDDASIVGLESIKDETSALEAEEQTHHLIGELMRRRSEQGSPPATTDTSTLPAEVNCDSDRASLISIEMISNARHADRSMTQDPNNAV